MSLIEPCVRSELAAHYKAVRARLWPARRPLLPPPVTEPESPWPSLPLPELEPKLATVLPAEDMAAKRREIDERLFGARVMPKTVISVTASYFGLPVEALCGRCRKENIAKARHAAIYLMHTLCRQVRYRGRKMDLVRFSFPQIAHHFSLEHSTAYHSVERARRRMAGDEKYATAISDITTLLQRGEKK